MKVKTKPLNWSDLSEGIEIDIPIEQQTAPNRKQLGRTELFKSKVTIYNDIPADGVNARRFDRFVINFCNIQKGILQNADGTIEKVVNAQTIITKDIEHYKTPLEYARLPFKIGDLQVGGYEPLENGEYKRYFTVNVNDFVVLAEVDDVVTTSREFQELQSKYRNNGFSVTAVNEYLNGMNVDNIQIIHA